MITDTVKLNIDFAKRNLVDTIYTQAVLEGIATTYADTERIIEGGKVSNMTADDIMKIVNLKRAWQFILDEDTITAPTDFALLARINQKVIDGFYYNAGKLRSVPVRIGGTSWTPELPLESRIKEGLEKILSMPRSDNGTDEASGTSPNGNAGEVSDTSPKNNANRVGDASLKNNAEQKDRDLEVETALRLLLYITKKQVFIDGNKRTAVIFANHYLISHGLGIVVVSEELIDEYKKLLIDFYESPDDATSEMSTEILAFLKTNCYRSLA